MNHASIELAKKLKEAGLVWGPKRGDWLYYDQKTLAVLLVEECNLFVVQGIEIFTIAEYPERSLTWLPSLSQLLAEIEGRGYIWKQSKYSSKQYLIKLYALDEKGLSLEAMEYADTPEEATGLALLWILKQEKRDKEAKGGQPQND